MKEKADFTLLFKADGSVELLDRRHKSIWSSDNDEDFSEEFGGDTFFSDEEDSEDIIAYLDEKSLIDSDIHEIDVVENDLEDEADDDDDDVIDAEFEEH